MNLDYIQNLLRKGEGFHCEFKESGNKLPYNLFESVCAFLNTDGGTILLGVNDNAEIKGIEPRLINQIRKTTHKISSKKQKL
mgnify:CR=1 FL=1